MESVRSFSIKQVELSGIRGTSSLAEKEKHSPHMHCEVDIEYLNFV